VGSIPASRTNIKGLQVYACNPFWFSALRLQITPTVLFAVFFVFCSIAFWEIDLLPSFNFKLPRHA
jgi:hypothetical protein